MTRTFWTLCMLAAFFAALFMGHIYIIIIITLIQIVSFKEVIAIANVPSRARSLRSTKSLNWYWLATTMYFLYGESVIYYFKHIVLVDKVLLPLATHHRFISFILYVFGRFNAFAAPEAHHYTIMRPKANQKHRFCLLCCFAPRRTLQIPIHQLCMDSHGSVPHRRPSPFRHE